MLWDSGKAYVYKTQDRQVVPTRDQCVRRQRMPSPSLLLGDTASILPYCGDRKNAGHWLYRILIRGRMHCASGKGSQNILEGRSIRTCQVGR